MCDTYNCDYLNHSTFRFNLIDFQLNFAFFTVKSPSVKYHFLKKMLIKRAKTRHKTIVSDNSFTLIENNFRFLR